MSLTRFIKDVLRKPETKIATDIVEKMGNGTILDLGSGIGYLAIEIAKKAPSLQVYGIDLSRQMVKIARRHAKGVDNARFVFGNAAKLPFKDNSIDLVISTGASHHWKTPRMVFDECYRVLKTGKEAWIYDGCPEVFNNRADRREKQLSGTLWGGERETLALCHSLMRRHKFMLVNEPSSGLTPKIGDGLFK